MRRVQKTRSGQNHYAGFGPTLAHGLLKMYGLWSTFVRQVFHQDRRNLL